MAATMPFLNTLLVANMPYVLALLFFFLKYQNILCYFEQGKFQLNDLGCLL